MVYFEHQARELNIPTPCITFVIWKEPLYKDKSNNILDPKQWGWKLEGSVFTPILTDLHAAPDSLLKFVRCKCKLLYKNSCSTNICSCRKNGLKCVTACGDCHGDCHREGYNNSE